MKYWVSAGRGGFGLSSSECVEESLYCICTSENTEPVDRTVGLAACSSPIVPKPYPFGTLKSTNYLPNVLAKIHAEESGIDVVRLCVLYFPMNKLIHLGTRIQCHLRCSCPCRECLSTQKDSSLRVLIQILAFWHKTMCLLHLLSRMSWQE